MNREWDKIPSRLEYEHSTICSEMIPNPKTSPRSNVCMNFFFNLEECLFSNPYSIKQDFPWFGNRKLFSKHFLRLSFFPLSFPFLSFHVNIALVGLERKGRTCIVSWVICFISTLVAR